MKILPMIFLIFATLVGCSQSSPEKSLQDQISFDIKQPVITDNALKLRANTPTRFVVIIDHKRKIDIPTYMELIFNREDTDVEQSFLLGSKTLDDTHIQYQSAEERPIVVTTVAGNYKLDFKLFSAHTNDLIKKQTVQVKIQ